MELDKTIDAKFTFKKEKVRDTDTDVIVVRDENDGGKRVCMIHPGSGTLCFKFRGTLTDFSAGLNFYSIAEIQILLDAAKKINKAHGTFEKALDKTLKEL